jgi:DNA-binding ferritin-like protein (Dps family)
MNKVIAKVIGEKRQWRQYKARTRQLPANYRTAVEALERYLMYCGPGGDGVEAAALEDPVEFLKTFVRNYPDGQWRLKEQKRLNDAIARAAGESISEKGAV